MVFIVLIYLVMTDTESSIIPGNYVSIFFLELLYSSPKQFALEYSEGSIRGNILLVQPYTEGRVL